MKQQNLRNKALIVDREDWKTDLLSLDPSKLEHLAKHSSQNLKTRSSIEGTAHSCGHNSLEAGTKDPLLNGTLSVQLKADEPRLMAV